MDIFGTIILLTTVTVVNMCRSLLTRQALGFGTSHRAPLGEVVFPSQPRGTRGQQRQDQHQAGLAVLTTPGSSSLGAGEAESGAASRTQEVRVGGAVRVDHD